MSRKPTTFLSTTPWLLKMTFWQLYWTERSSSGQLTFAWQKQSAKIEICKCLLIRTLTQRHSPQNSSDQGENSLLLVAGIVTKTQKVTDTGAVHASSNLFKPSLGRFSEQFLCLLEQNISDTLVFGWHAGTQILLIGNATTSNWQTWIWANLQPPWLDGRKHIHKHQLCTLIFCTATNTSDPL